MNGLLLVNKSQGMSSHDVVKRIRQLTRMRKVGHAGTLDPTAEGLLLVCVGKATKLTPFLQELDKSYDGRMVFGITTDTLDEEGEVRTRKDARSLTRERVGELFAGYHGKLSQVPPMHSAVHWKGQRLYELARAGTTVDVSPRTVFVYDLQLLDFVPGPHPTAEFSLRCSKGTYVRSLCRDIGEATSYGAHQAYLRRTKVGSFSLQNAKTLEELADAETADSLENVALDMVDILPHFPRVRMKEGTARLVQWGRPLYLSHLAEVPLTLEKGDRVRICASDGRLLALAVALQNGLHFSKEKTGFKYLRVLA